MTELSQPDLDLRTRMARPWRFLFLGYLLLLTIGTHMPNPELGIAGGPALLQRILNYTTNT